MAFADIASEYRSLFASCVVRPDKAAIVQQSHDALRRHRRRYEFVAAKFNGMPWYFVGIIHGIESNFDFKTHLHNGDPLVTRTVHAPVGRPHSGAPPFTWEESAQDALILQNFGQESDFSLPRMLFLFERYNGMGYRLLGLASPYLWGFSNHYAKGEVGKDGRFNPEAVSEKIGAATLLKTLQTAGEVFLPDANQPAHSTTPSAFLETQTDAVSDAHNVNGTDQVGTMHIQLADEISVHQLTATLAVMEKVYFDALWVERAEEALVGVFPDNYSPLTEEELWINQLDIGTPNFLELLGDLNALTEVAKYLGAFITTLAGGKLLVQYGELRRKLAEASLINARAKQLYENGRISHRGLLRSTAEIGQEQAEAMVAALSPHQPTPTVRSAPIKKVDAAIRAELKSINRPDVLPILRDHFKARRAKLRGHKKPEIEATIEATYQHLQTALGPDGDLLGLIERIDQAGS